MKRKTTAIVGGVLVVASLAAFWMQRHDLPPRQDARIVELFGGEAGLRTVTHPTKVEAYRLKPNLKLDGSEYTDLKNNYEITAEPISVPETLATELSRDLTNLSSYWWNAGKLCIPRYGVRLSFHRGQDQVDVFLCFECKELRVSRNGKVTSGPGNDKSFDSMNGRLVLAAKTLFPDDPEIQELQAIDYELPESRG